jgi:hypothetical protein
MSAKVVNTAILAGLLCANIASAFAAGPPKTKAECEKLTDMQWDAKTKKCVKK